MKSIAQKVMANFGLDVDFMTLNILKLIFFHILRIHYKLEGIITKTCRNSLILCNFIMF